MKKEAQIISLMKPSTAIPDSFIYQWCAEKNHDGKQFSTTEAIDLLRDFADHLKVQPLSPEPSQAKTFEAVDASQAQSVEEENPIANILKYWHTFDEDDIELIRKKLLPLLLASQTQQPGKSLEACKDEVAKKHGRLDWADCCDKVSINEWSFTVLDELNDEVAELYAQSQSGGWDCIEKIRNISEDTGRVGCNYGDTEYDSLSAVYGYNLALQQIKSMLPQPPKQ